MHRASNNSWPARLDLHNFACQFFRALSSPHFACQKPILFFVHRARLISHARKPVSFFVSGARLDLLAHSASRFASCVFCALRSPRWAWQKFIFSWMEPASFFVHPNSPCLACTKHISYCVPLFFVCRTHLVLRACTEPALFLWVEYASSCVHEVRLVFRACCIFFVVKSHGHEIWNWGSIIIHWSALSMIHVLPKPLIPLPGFIYSSIVENKRSSNSIRIVIQIQSSLRNHDSSSIPSGHLHT